MEHNKNRSLRKSQAAFFIGITALLGIFGILLFILPPRAYSENENRCLTAFQKVTLSSFLDTSMQENMTDAASDQFLGRDFWIKSAVCLQRSVGFLDAGGVYFGKDGYYFERILDSRISESRYSNNLKYLDQFAASYQEGHKTEVSFLPVPSAGIILKEKLPAHAVLYHAGRLYGRADTQLESAGFLDIRSALADAADLADLTSESENSLYFKTDHHWTMNGAYAAYAAWCSAHGAAPKPLAQFSPECASKAFYGTLFSKAPGFWTKPDTLFIPKNLPKAEIIVDSKKTDGIYDWKKLKTKDKYGVYFGGNFGRIDIRLNAGTGAQNEDGINQTAAAGKKLLIIKDSFANSMVPFLMGDGNYEEIIMLDLRYYNESVSELMQKEQPQEALVLYEMSNFAQDMNFFKLLK